MRFVGVVYFCLTFDRGGAGTWLLWCLIAFKFSKYHTCCNELHQDRHNQERYHEASQGQYTLCSLDHGWSLEQPRRNANQQLWLSNLNKTLKRFFSSLAGEHRKWPSKGNWYFKQIPSTSAVSNVWTQLKRIDILIDAYLEVVLFRFPSQKNVESLIDILK